MAGKPKAKKDLGKFYLVVVPQECITCGTCAAICPEVFFVDKSRGYARVSYSGEEPPEKIREALGQCPVGCIHAVEVG